MKAVRGADGGVVVDELDEPPGSGELIDMGSTSVCASDLMYIGFGSRRILGHELAGLREDGTPVVVEALYGCMECEQCAPRHLQPVPHARPARPRRHCRRRHGRAVPGAAGTARPVAARPRRARRVDRRAGVGVVARAAPGRHRTGQAGRGRRCRGARPARRRGCAPDGCGRRRLEVRHPHQREAGERLGARVRGRRRRLRRRDRGGRHRREPALAPSSSWPRAARSSCSACTWAGSS